MTRAKVRRMFAVESNMILKLGFDPLSPGIEYGMLVVQFTNLDVWLYENVAYTDYLQLMNAPSIGAAFTTIIKAKYEGKQLQSKDTHVVNPDNVAKPTPSAAEELPLLDTLDGTKETRAKRRK